jgi:hypothetical protein
MNGTFKPVTHAPAGVMSWGIRRDCHEAAAAHYIPTHGYELRLRRYCGRPPHPSNRVRMQVLGACPLRGAIRTQTTPARQPHGHPTGWLTRLADKTGGDCPHRYADTATTPTCLQRNNDSAKEPRDLRSASSPDALRQRRGAEGGATRFSRQSRSEKLGQSGRRSAEHTSDDRADKQSRNETKDDTNGRKQGRRAHRNCSNDSLRTQ